jgi:hypothetical protein
MPPLKVAGAGRLGLPAAPPERDDHPNIADRVLDWSPRKFYVGGRFGAVGKVPRRRPLWVSASVLWPAPVPALEKVNALPEQLGRPETLMFVPHTDPVAPGSFDAAGQVVSRYVLSAPIISSTSWRSRRDLGTDRNLSPSLFEHRLSVSERNRGELDAVVRLHPHQDDVLAGLVQVGDLRM